MDFSWRIRAHIRSAINLPYNKNTESNLPSGYVEMGWTMYTHQDLNQAEAVRSVTIDENRFPVWNHELVYYPPKNVTTLDGFINFFVKDRFAVKPIQKIIIPLNTLRPYHPAHLVFILITIHNHNF